MQKQSQTNKVPQPYEETRSDVNNTNIISTESEMPWTSFSLNYLLKSPEIVVLLHQAVTDLNSP